jgi:predicted metal-binding membrane protein
VNEAAPAAARRGPLLAIGTLLFVVSVAGTVHWSRTMAMGMWMPFAAFLAMWVAMMGAMMIPSLAPTLLRDDVALDSAALSAAGYFTMWAAFGAGVYAVAVAVVAAEMRWLAFARAIPTLRGCVLIAAGLVQLSPWKARHLQCCREAGPEAAQLGAAWRRGISFGVDCVLCCLPLMTVLVVLGMMSLPLIALLAVAITAERIARKPAPIVRLVGMLTLAIGVFEIVK